MLMAREFTDADERIRELFLRVLYGITHGIESTTTATGTASIWIKIMAANFGRDFNFECLFHVFIEFSPSPRRGWGLVETIFINLCQSDDCITHMMKFNQLNHIMTA